MNVLDLFSGIGGFSLGLERAGMRTVAFCEIDPYCRDRKMKIPFWLKIALSWAAAFAAFPWLLKGLAAYMAWVLF